jgi:hypothetical protein
MIQTLFLNKDAIFQGDTAGTVQSWFEEHKAELQQIPWPVKSPDLNITEPLLIVLKTKGEKQIPASNISKRNLKMFFKKIGIIFRYRPFKTYKSTFKEVPQPY